MESRREVRYRRARKRLADLELIIAAGGSDELSGWALREEVFVTLERLPRLEMRAWLDANGKTLRAAYEKETPQGGRENRR